MYILRTIGKRYLLNNTVHCLSKEGSHSIQTELFKISSRSMLMRAVKQDAFGDADTLYVSEVQVPELASNQILVKVSSTAVNRADMLICKGLYPGQKKDTAPETLGLEMAGKVTSIGSAATKWKIGDRVMALLPKGGYAEYVAVNENHVMPVPDAVSILNAGGLPEVWLTAYQLLHLVGSVNENDYVLIHGGGSGVGTAATQLVKLAGAIPVVTAGSKDKIDVCLSLGAKAGFNYKEDEFYPGVLEATEGKGANLILDCVGGNFWKQNLHCLARDGTWVNYGLLGGANIDGNFFGPLLAKRGRLLSTTLKSRDDDYKARLISEFVKNALPFFSNPAVMHGQEIKLKPVIDNQFLLKNVADAHRYVSQNKNIGKVLINVSEE